MLLRQVGRVTIVVPPEMCTRALVLLVAVMAFAAPSFAVDVRDEAKARVEFGIKKVAQQGLWKEATYRWEKATRSIRRAPKRGTTSRSVTNTKAGSKMRRRRTSKR